MAYASPAADAIPWSSAVPVAGTYVLNAGSGNSAASILAASPISSGIAFVLPAHPRAPPAAVEMARCVAIVPGLDLTCGHRRDDEIRYSARVPRRGVCSDRSPPAAATPSTTNVPVASDRFTVATKTAASWAIFEIAIRSYRLRQGVEKEPSKRSIRERVKRLRPGVGVRREPERVPPIAGPVADETVQVHPARKARRIGTRTYPTPARSNARACNRDPCRGRKCSLGSQTDSRCWCP